MCGNNVFPNFKKQTFAKNKNTGDSWSSSFALQYNRTFLTAVGSLDI
jgi:hypothetical protein